MDPSPDRIKMQSWLDGLEETVVQTLSQKGAGLSEFELLKQLRAKNWLGDFSHSQEPQLKLFQTHFLLFHVLYRLQTRVWEQRSGHLEISPLCIRMLPYQSGLDGLQVSDPLRVYYLDLDKLFETDSEDVERMLDGFWQRYLAGEGREDALTVLGLSEPVDRKTIERRYRELAAQHHPDRGGDGQMLVSINKAVGILRQYYID